MVRIAFSLAIEAAVIGLTSIGQAIPARAQSAQASPQSLRLFVEPDQSEVDYEVHARLFLIADENIVGRNQAVSGQVSLDGTQASGEIRIGATGFKSGVGTRDRHVEQILDADDFPDLRFDVSAVEGFAPGTSTGECTVNGTLTVRDRHVPLTLPVRYRVSGGYLQLDGAVRTRFSAFGIAPPVLGFIVKRAPDDLLLRAHLVARMS